MKKINSSKKPRNRKTKNILVFDEKSRFEYLTGFSKRKKIRQKKAQEEIAKKIKEERKVLKQKRREFNSGNNKKHQSLPTDLEDIADKQVTDLPDHTVTITDVSDIDLAGQASVYLGLNKFKDDKNTEASSSDEESQIPQSTSQLSRQQQQQILRKIEAKIDKRRKHVKTKAPNNTGSKARTLSKKKKHMKKMQKQNYCKTK